MGFEKPFEFWQRLADEHQRDLDSVGFSLFKRHQALRYFTWQWRWRSIPRSEQFRFLLSHSSPVDLLRAALAPAGVVPPWHLGSRARDQETRFLGIACIGRT